MVPAAKHGLNLPIELLEPIGCWVEPDWLSPAGSRAQLPMGSRQRQTASQQFSAEGGTEPHFEQQTQCSHLPLCAGYEYVCRGRGSFYVDSAAFTSIMRNGPWSQSARSANRSDVSDLCTITAAVHVQPWHNKSGWSDPSVPARLFHFLCGRRPRRRDRRAECLRRLLPNQPPSPIHRVIEAICRDEEIMKK